MVDGYWLLALACAALSILTVLCRAALQAFSFPDVEDLLRRQNRTRLVLPKLERFAEQLDLHIQTLHLLTLVLQALGAVALFLGVHVSLHDGQGLLEFRWVEWLVFTGSYLLFLLLTQVVIEPVAQAHAERTVLALWRVILLLHWLSWIVLLPIRLMLLLRRHLGRHGGDEEGNEERFEDEIKAVVALGEVQGQIPERLGEMIDSIINLQDTTAEELMTPRTDMHALAVEAGAEGALDMSERTGHSRLPVYEDNRDNILGIVYVKDLLAYHKRELPELDRILRQPLYVPASKLVHELFDEICRNRVHVAIVLDEYGGTAGLVTLEDIIEEVFGEIDDEYDTIGESEVTHVDDGIMVLDAKVHVDEINEQYDLNLPESDAYESLGGLLTTQLARIPAAGAVWESDHLRLTVLEATERKVVRVRLERKGDVAA